MSDAFDVVVIGSGFGGSIAACRLAQAGRRVCVLERGRRWTSTEFPRSPSEVSRDAFWDLPRGRFGLLEYKAFRHVHVIQGCGVGGGSLHYFNVHMRPPDSIFDDPRWPKEVTPDVLDPYYRLAREMLDAAPLSPPTGRTLPVRTRAFTEACRRSGHEPALVDIAVYTGDGRRNPYGDVPQQPCDYSGACALGCATKAKNSLDVSYLALAEKHGAQVRPLHQVDRIEPLPRGGYRVRYARLRPNGPGLPEPGWVEGDGVVVAAGTLGTNELLLRCRDRHGTLPRLSDALGRGFSGNGDLLLAGTLTDRDVDPTRGPSITVGADFSTPRQQIYIEDLGFPDPVMWFIEGMLANAVPTINLVRWGKLFLKGSLGISGATDRLGHERERLFGGGRTRGFLPYLGMCQDAADGQFVLDRDGNLDLHWDPARSLPNFVEMENAMRSLSRALDGTYVASPLWSPPLREALTAHPLGGCVMANDRWRGVVNSYGEVFEYPGLFVMDGSIIPAPLARNPTATISALAERAVFHLIHGREMGADDVPTTRTVIPAPAAPTDDVAVLPRRGAHD
ncbi:MAG: GMC oxidoreductase [Mycobacterium leprae]